MARHDMAINKPRLVTTKHHERIERNGSTMKVAIIGAGNIGKALGGSLARAGHEVTLAASHAEHAADAAREIGATSARSTAIAAQNSDVVILAVPYQAAEAVAADLAPVVGNRTVVDVTNPLKPDYSDLAVDGTSAAEQLQQRLPGARVVKAFNTLFASVQANPSAKGAPAQALIAGDDAEAKADVAQLARSIGLEPIDVGPLSWARHMERLAFFNIGLNATQGWDWTSAWRLVR
jgi:NADPH-dependent F420 reductase